MTEARGSAAALIVAARRFFFCLFRFLLFLRRNGEGPRKRERVVSLLLRKDIVSRSSSRRGL